MITYNNKNYPTREMTIMIDGEATDITIATQSLSDAMGDEKEVNDSEEEGIDEDIYFYVGDDEIDLPEDVIAGSYLDESFVLAPAEEED